MRIYTTEGIIFKTVKYSETSIICDIYTREKGLRSYIVSGVRTSRSGSKAAIYRPLNLIEIVAYDNEGENLNRIKEIYLNHHFQHLNSDVVLSAIGIFMLEVSRNAIKEKEPNQDLYTFLLNWFLFLDNKLNYHPCLHLRFMIELSIQLGFGPMENYGNGNFNFDLLDATFCNYPAGGDYILDQDESGALFELITYQKDNLYNLQMTKALRIKTAENLINYFKIHISGFRDLNSFDVLKNVL